MGKRATKAGVLVLALLMVGLGMARASVVQEGNLRISVSSQISPYKLPRHGTAPIAVFVAGHVSSPGGGVPPRLMKMTVLINRHGLLQSKGLPVCRLPQIQPASTERALENCGSAVIGSGQFWANIILPGQDPYPTHGRLLVFNGRDPGPVILAHIFTANPFPTSFVVRFSIQHIHQGPYGTRLTASLPEALGTWGYVDRIKLTLRRKYRYRGAERSYFNAGCPAPPGVTRVSFPLAYASFSFAENRELGATVNKTCGVSE